MRNLIGIFSSGVPQRTFLTGGVLTSDSTYYYRTFTFTDNLTVSKSIAVEYLVVAPGAGGGLGGGGGGAGGLRYGSATLTAGTYQALVGAGATQNTSAGNSSFNSLISTGGGVGAGYLSNAESGGSGGGGRNYSPPPVREPASGIPGQGNSGGTYGSWGSGGGGGAGAAGSPGGNSPTNLGGAGGSGSNSYSSWASATSTGVDGYYAGGGGGGTQNYNYQALGGAGGGGLGNFATPSFEHGGQTMDAVANTGGGGGGGATTSSQYGYIHFGGGNGGSGIVIVRYLKTAV